jgi:hypothetical protein
MEREILILKQTHFNVNNDGNKLTYDRVSVRQSKKREQMREDGQVGWKHVSINVSLI